MLRPFLTLAALGVAGVVAWKLLWGLVLPVFAMVLGALFFVLRIALVALLVYVAYRMFQKVMERRPETTV